MKTKYKYIHFVQDEAFSKMKDADGRQYHQLWMCYNTNAGGKLGHITWYVYWQQYCIEFAEAIFSADCLKDIADFLEQLNAKKGNNRDEIGTDSALSKEAEQNE